MKSFVKITLAAAILSISTASFAANTANNNAAASVSPAERAKIEEVVHQYLLRKPEVLVEVLQILQKRQYEQAEQTVQQTKKMAANYSKALFNQNDDPIAGNPNGKITVVEFFDYQCPHCVDMAPVMDAIIKANPDVRVIYKEFPIRGPISNFAARAALAALKQGKYNEFSHALLTSNQPLTNDTILTIAKNTGLDVDKLKKDMSDQSVDTQIKNNTKLAQDLKLFGTPAFFIGKTTGDNSTITYIPGQMNQAQLQDEIDKASK